MSIISPEMKQQNAQIMFEKLKRRFIEAHKLKVDVDEDKRIIHYFVKGADLPMEFVFFVGEQTQSIRGCSLLPFNVRPEKSGDMAMAACAANVNQAIGYFEYDIDEGRLQFVFQQSFLYTELDDRLLDLLIMNALERVRANIGRFFALNAGYLTLGGFMTELKGKK